MKVVDIIPTYNEKENIKKMLDTLADIATKNPQYEFTTLVADDHSPDGTAEIVRKYMKKDKSVKLIEGPKIGLGEALIRGYQYAMKEMKADVVIPNDCDFSFDPYKITELLKKIEEGFDVVVGSRHVGGGGTAGWSFFRKLNHWVANELFAWHVAGIKEVHDHNGNFKVIRVKGVLDQVPLEKLKVKGFGFQCYILYELSKVTKKFAEVPVIFKFRTAGETKVSFNSKYFKYYLRDTLEYIKLSLMVRLERSQQFFKFCVVGFIGYLVNAIGLEVFYRLGMTPGPATAVATELAIISNFTLNNIWTFAHKKIVSIKHLPFKFLEFNLTSLGALIIQTTVVWIGTSILGDQWRQILLIFAIGLLVLPYNYFMYTVFIWKTKSLPFLKSRHEKDQN